MRIHELGRGTDSGWVEAFATVTWEDADRPARRLVFATAPEHGADLVPNPDAFLLAAVMPALHHGERRVRVDGALCPHLRDGLEGALRRLHRWQGRTRALAIEASAGFAPPLPRRPERTAAFLSGGIDSLATLRCNRRDFPAGHPGAIADCLLVHGFDAGGAALPDRSARFDRLRDGLEEVARAAGATLVPIATNLRELEDPGVYFAAESCGAALAAVAHALAPRLTDVLVAASASLSDPGPLGAHPLLDPAYASAADVRLHEHGAWLERLEKVALVAAWNEALQRIRVCNDPQFAGADPPNCGRCEKCVLTMVELLVVGKLAACSAFGADDVAPERIADLAPPFPPRGVDAQSGPRADAFAIGLASTHPWRELVAPLARIGRDDLAREIAAKLARCDRLAQRRGRGWRGALGRLVRRLRPVPQNGATGGRG